MPLKNTDWDCKKVHNVFPEHKKGPIFHKGFVLHRTKINTYRAYDLHRKHHASSHLLIGHIAVYFYLPVLTFISFHTYSCSWAASVLKMFLKRVNLFYKPPLQALQVEVCEHLMLSFITAQLLLLTKQNKT